MKRGLPDIAAVVLRWGRKVEMVQRLAGYTAMGPFLQGFEGGWHDLSRGCSAKDVFKVAVMAICMKRGNLLN